MIVTTTNHYHNLRRKSLMKLQDKIAESQEVNIILSDNFWDEQYDNIMNTLEEDIPEYEDISMYLYVHENELDDAMCLARTWKNKHDALDDYTLEDMTPIDIFETVSGYSAWDIPEILDIAVSNNVDSYEYEKISDIDNPIILKEIVMESY